MRPGPKRPSLALPARAELAHQRPDLAEGSGAGWGMSEHLMWHARSATVAEGSMVVTISNGKVKLCRIAQMREGTDSYRATVSPVTPLAWFSRSVKWGVGWQVSDLPQMAAVARSRWCPQTCGPEPPRHEGTPEHHASHLYQSHAASWRAGAVRLHA